MASSSTSTRRERWKIRRGAAEVPEDVGQLLRRGVKEGKPVPLDPIVSGLANEIMEAVLVQRPGRGRVPGLPLGLRQPSFEAC